MFQFALGSGPERVMRLALEWLVLFDSETQGSETDLWREAERRAAENLSSLVVWFEEVRQRLPHSRVIQAALTALKSLAKFRTEGNLDMVERTLSQLEAAGYHLTTVWLLTRWAFLLREQRQEELANQCLERAAAIQASLPLTQPVPILLHQVGRRYYYQARFADALRSYWDGYRFLERTPGKDDLCADFYNSAGKCFNDMYQFALALELFERARQIRAKLRHNETLARSWGAMGEVYWRVGDLDDAERCFRQDIELSQQADRARNERREEMRAKNYLANVLFAKSAWDDAETLYRETETYYRARFEAGNTNEFRNLAYSLEGLARTAAARGQWDEVARLEQRDAEHAQRLLTPDDPAILPVALLRYLHALRWQHEHAPVGALTRLYEVEKMLEPLYPVERAMVGLEIIILEISRLPLEEPLAISASTQRLELASTSLRSLLDVREKPEVMACFAPICQEIEQGRGALEGKGQTVFAQDRQRREKLFQQFAAASRLLAAGNWDAATPLLREIQESVVFFRDIIKQVAW